MGIQCKDVSQQKNLTSVKSTQLLMHLRSLTVCYSSDVPEKTRNRVRCRPISKVAYVKLETLEKQQ